MSGSRSADRGVLGATFVDLLFLLLYACLCLQTTLEERARGYEVMLPTAPAGVASQDSAAPRTIEVEVLEDGTTWIDGGEVPAASLARHLAEVHRRDPAADVDLRVDAMTHNFHRVAVEVALRQAGFQRARLVVGAPSAEE